MNKANIDEILDAVAEVLENDPKSQDILDKLEADLKEIEVTTAEYKNAALK